MTAHSIFSASAAERWSACPGSIAMSRGRGDRRSEAAFEGTLGHTLTEQCLIDGTDPIDKEPRVFFENEWHDVKDDLLVAAQTCVDYVRSLGKPFVLENRVNYAALLGLDTDEAFGTLDVMAVDSNTLHIIDHKFGRRWVDPVKNKQLTLYAAAVVYGLEAAGEVVDQIVLHISQPRLFEIPQTFTYSRDELMEEVAGLRRAAQRAVEATMSFTKKEDIKWQDAYLVPGEAQCMYCRAAWDCPKLTAEVDDVFPSSTASADEFEVIMKEADAEELAYAHSRIPLLEIWIKAVEHEVNFRLSSNKKVPGKKMVLGREGNRKWGDEEEAEKKLVELGIPSVKKEPELKSPAQIEKAIKAMKLGKEGTAAMNEAIAELVIRSPAKPTVVDESHPGEPWVPTASIDEFKNLA